MFKSVCCKFLKSLILIFIIILTGTAFAQSDEGLDCKARYLIDEQFGSVSQLTAYDSLSCPSGWDVDRRGGELACAWRTSFLLRDTSEEYPIVLKRQFDEQTSGKLTLETYLCFSDLSDGFSYRLNSRDKNAVLKLVTGSNAICYVDNNNIVRKIMKCEEDIAYRIKLIIDIDNECAEFYSNGQFIMQIGFASFDKNLSEIEISTPDKKEMQVYLNYVYLYKNYAVNEKFLSSSVGSLPCDWEKDSLMDDSVMVEPIGSLASDPYSLKINDTSKIDKTTLVKKFEAITDNFCTELLFLLPQKSNGVTFSLNNKSTNVLSITTNDIMLYAKEKELCSYTENVWQTLRLEVNMKNQKAIFKLNGKIVTEIPFENSVQSIDNLKISTQIKEKTLLWIDDVAVFPILPDSDDYPTEPEVSKADNYYVGMQVCSLWREGYHQGWDCITPYDERTPYLGYYDEGNKEVSDWEIKWMAEHGIDYELFCWYPPTFYNDGPIKPSGVAKYAINDGYFNANYSNYLKFAISYQDVPSSAKVWRENIIPYWVDYFLKDPRYMTIDNKAVIAFYQSSGFSKNLGGLENAKIELDYLRQVCKDLGYDDTIFIFYSGGATESEFKKYNDYKYLGADAIIAYGWGANSYKPDYQKYMMQTQKEANIIDVIPTVSMGFNVTAWHKTNDDKPNISLKHYREILLWTKDNFMKSYSDDSLPSKMVMIDNWNEYGEGHYVMPSKLNGFGYLDAINDVFGSANKHTDIILNENQLERLRGLFPKDRKILRFISNRNEKISSKVMQGWSFNESNMGWRSEKQIEGLSALNGYLSGTSVGVDPSIVLQNDLSLNIDNSKYVHVRMKVTVDTNNAQVCEMFFTTEDNSSWSGKQVTRADIVPNEIHDYYFPMYLNEFWKGTLKQLRLDPITSKGTFEIECIELLEENEIPVTVELNGNNVKFETTPDDSDGTIMIPVNPLKGLQNDFGIYIEWNNKNQTISLIKNQISASFTVGGNDAIINGAERKLSCKPYFKNHLIMIPARLVFETFGAAVEWNGEEKKVIVKQKETLKAKDAEEIVRIPFEWEFNVNGDVENWKIGTGFSKVKVKDGILNLKSISNDPIIYLPAASMNSNKYRYVNIRIKNGSESNNLQIFFITDTDPNWNSEKCVTLNISIQDEDYVEYQIDMSANKKWTGNIIQLRFDPISDKGNFAIDYFRVTE